MDSAPPPNEDLAVWLKEAGKRRRSVPPGQADLPIDFSARASAAAKGETRKWLVLCAAGAIAYLQFFYAEVFLQILSAPSIIFFVLVHGQLPPM